MSCFGLDLICTAVHNKLFATYVRHVYIKIESFSAPLHQACNFHSEGIYDSNIIVAAKEMLLSFSIRDSVGTPASPASTSD